MSLPPKHISALSSVVYVNAFMDYNQSFGRPHTPLQRHFLFFKGLNKKVLLSQVQHDLWSLGFLGNTFSMFLKGLRASAHSLSVSREQSKDAAQCFPSPLTCEPDYFPSPLSLHIV